MDGEESINPQEWAEWTVYMKGAPDDLRVVAVNQEAMTAC